MTEVMKWGEDPEFSGPRDWFRNSLLIKSLLNCTRSGKLLDYGCGSGYLVNRLTKYSFDLTGVDISTSAIKFAKKFSPRVKFKRVSTDYLSTTKDKYDVILSGEVIEHIQDDKKMISNFYRVTNPGGFIIISTPAHSHYWDINDTFSSHFRRYEIPQLNELFASCGFKSITSCYWGWPLGYFWHRLIYIRLIRSKMNHKIKYTGQSSFLGKLLSAHRLKQLVSYLFYVDQLFNWTHLGGGIIAIYQKPSSFSNH